MEFHDDNLKLLFGLFGSICGWAYDEGIRDISSLKNLLKLSMVDVCRKRHTAKRPIYAQMGIVTDLGLSLRNVQRALKALDEIQDLATGFVKIREIQKEIAVALTRQSLTFEEVLSEVAYLIHAPYELQRRTLKVLLNEMIEKEIVEQVTEKRKTTYQNKETQVKPFNPVDLPFRIMAATTYIDAFKHTVGVPYLKTVQVTTPQVKNLQTAINDCLREVGNAHEQKCSELKQTTKPYYYYLGSAPLTHSAQEIDAARAVLEVIRVRLSDPEAPGFAEVHWYKLMETSAETVFNEVRNFIEREASVSIQNSQDLSRIPFTFNFGLADCHKNKIQKED